MHDQGFHNIPADQYHADPCDTPSLSYSVAKVLLNQSPKHAKSIHPRLSERPTKSESSRLDLGTAAHDLLLEGGTARICVINPEDYRSKPTKANPEGAVPSGWTNTAIRAARDEARSNGLVPILPWDNAALRGMLSEAQEFVQSTEIKGIFNEGDPELTAVWQESNGIWCRSRLDRMSSDRKIILDYKTCENAEPEAAIRQITRMGYDIQSAFYSRGVAAITGVSPMFVFLFQEIEPPYACSLIALDGAYMEIANARVCEAIQTWGDCLKSNRWPAYPSRICYAEPTSWQLAQYEQTYGEPALGDPFGEK